MSYLFYIFSLMITIIIMIIANLLAFRSSLSKRESKRTREISFGEQITNEIVSDIKELTRIEDKRILISKRLLNFWGTFLSQGAISITLMALIVWFSKNYSYSEIDGFNVAFEDTEIFFYCFLIIIQFLIYVTILVWRNHYMLELMKLERNDINKPFFNLNWKFKIEGKIAISTILGGAMLYFSIVLLETFIK